MNILPSEIQALTLQLQPLDTTTPDGATDFTRLYRQQLPQTPAADKKVIEFNNYFSEYRAQLQVPDMAAQAALAQSWRDFVAQQQTAAGGAGAVVAANASAPETAAVDALLADAAVIGHRLTPALAADAGEALPRGGNPLPGDGSLSNGPAMNQADVPGAVSAIPGIMPISEVPVVETALASTAIVSDEQRIVSANALPRVTARETPAPQSRDRVQVATAAAIPAQVSDAPAPTARFLSEPAPAWLQQTRLRAAGDETAARAAPPPAVAETPARGDPALPPAGSDRLADMPTQWLRQVVAPPTVAANEPGRERAPAQLAATPPMQNPQQRPRTAAAPTLPPELSTATPLPRELTASTVPIWQNAGSPLSLGDAPVTLQPRPLEAVAMPLASLGETLLPGRPGVADDAMPLGAEAELVRTQLTTAKPAGERAVFENNFDRVSEMPQPKPVPTTQSSVVTPSGPTPPTAAPGAANVALASPNPLPPQLETLSLPRQGDAAEWGNGLGERVSWMINQKHNSALIRLDPPLLGKLEVQVRVADDATTITIQTQHAQTRELIESASHRLRDYLQESGYQNVNVDVSQRQDQQQARAQGQFASDAEVTDEAEAQQSAPDEAQALTDYLKGDGLLDTFA